jgi:hypothetical protein
VFLRRRLDERVDRDLHDFYTTLIHAVGNADLHEGAWRLCECTGSQDDESWQQLLAWTWTAEPGRRLVVVNFADAPARGWVELKWPELAERSWRLEDAISGDRVERDGTELRDAGLHVELEPWGSQILAFQAGPAVRPTASPWGPGADGRR